MKKIAIVAAIATSAAVAAPFNGFSVGSSLGLNFVKNKIECTAVGKLAGGVDSSKNKVNFMLNVFAGYTKTFGNMFAGADLGLGVESMGDDLFGLKFDGNVYSRSISLAPRLGYKFNDTTAVYGKFAIAYNSYNIKGTVTDLIKKSNTSYMPAIGFEKFVSSNASVQVELGYDINKLNLTDAGKVVINKVSKNGVVASVGYRYSF